MSLAEKLLDWYSENGRELPWRQSKDPYIIWLSEIILQQTRVEQGMPYFYRFVESFPTVESFALAAEEEVLRLWQGLGYYSRARNMHKAAKMVIHDFGGLFPTAYKDLLLLPGVGEYTAAAISSFSMNADQAVLDGNVFRVLSRFFAIDEPINTTKGKKLFQSVADELLPSGQAGVYNQAMMDFGAMQCKPKAPLCISCPLHLDCRALGEGRVSDLPVKIKAKASRNRYFHYFVHTDGQSLLMNKRSEGDVWANLYEFPMLETASDMVGQELVNLPEYKFYFEGARLELIDGPIKHVLSHQNIFAKFYRIPSDFVVAEKKDGWNYFLLEKLDNLAKHKLIFSFINKHVLTN